MISVNRFENHLIDNRQVRIFLSSTFSDMQEERDALVQTFEMLKVEAAKRNVSLSVVDLRWGVTEEEAKSGKVISVCLNEIENSHPFFIGILGSNYGTAPEPSELEKNPELKERYDWIERAISEGMSITEMEMQYGVLCNNDDIDAAFFFKKSNQPDNNKRLTTLKEEVREKYDPNCQNDYTTASELCEKVTAEVRKIIDKHFPEKEVVTPLDRERTAQRSYINSRHSYYFERQSYFDIIDSFVHSDEQYLVFTGESGIGKSALLANWIKKNENNPEFNLVYHFVGNSFSGNCYENILRHLCDEIYDLYNVKKDKRDGESIENEAQRVVAEISINLKPLVFIIDGIDQIVSTNNDKLLLWLPSAVKNVKFIFSTLPYDETMRTFKRRGYRIVEVLPLTKDERKIWIPKYLMRVGKKLDEEKWQLDRIINDKECENTLVLRTLLDELSCFGIYEKIDERINYYLSASSIQDFFDHVLQRMEDDYSANQGLVRHALILIAVSEHGLSEDELLAILGLQERSFEWHLFFCAIYNHFVVKNGIITFSHHYISDAVISRYHLEEKNQSYDYRKEIIKVFSSLYGNEDRRCTYELGYQYYSIDNYEQLYQLLMSFSSFSYYYETDFYRNKLARYWNALLTNNYHLEDYLNLASEKEMPYLEIGMFAQSYFGAFNVSLAYYQAHYNHYKDIEGLNNPNMTSAIVNIGFVFKECGEYEKAIEFYTMALDNAERNIGTDNSYVSGLYSNIGNIYTMLHKFEDALSYHFKALEIEEKTLGEEHTDTAITYNNIGGALFKMGAYKQAWEYHYKALNIFENSIGIENPQTLTVMNNVATALAYIDIDRALEIHLTILPIREKLLGFQHPDTAFTYNNIGGVYKEKGDFNNALLYYKKALPIFEKVYENRHPIIGTLYGNIGQIYGLLGNIGEAVNYYLQAIVVLENTLGSTHQQTVKLYNVIANLLLQNGNEKDALDYLRKILVVFNDVLGTNHPNTIKVKEDIASLETRLSPPRGEQPSNSVREKEENPKKSFWEKLFGKK